MDQQTIRKLQLEELNMLKEIDRICERHGLTYFVLGGTLLGAVRHKGFIPWDDDLDIAFKRDEYEAFLKYAQEELPPPLKVIHLKNDPKYIYAFGRVINPNIKLRREFTKNQTVQSLWVDVFPLDTAPGKGIKKFIWDKELYILRGIRNIACFSEIIDTKKKYHGIKKLIVSIALRTNIEKLFDIHRSVERLDRFLTGWASDSNTRIGNPLGAWWYKEIFPIEYYEDTVRLPFEDMEVTCPKEYDAVLTQIYGDYMTPPPEDKRNKHGTSLVSWYGVRCDELEEIKS